jgi:hypothetical protein
MSVLIVVRLRRNMFDSAVLSERSLILWAAHSAFSSEQGTPQTFSV